MTQVFLGTVMIPQIFQLVPLLSSQGIFELGANPLAPPPAKGKAKKA